MKRGRFPEEQIIAVLREQEAGISTAEVCRKHGVQFSGGTGVGARAGGYVNRGAREAQGGWHAFHELFMAYQRRSSEIFVKVTS